MIYVHSRPSGFCVIRGLCPIHNSLLITRPRSTGSFTEVFYERVQKPIIYSNLHLRFIESNKMYEDLLNDENVSKLA